MDLIQATKKLYQGNVLLQPPYLGENNGAGNPYLLKADGDSHMFRRNRWHRDRDGEQSGRFLSLV